ncbi:MAG: response regulator transcription factor [Rhodothermales bacterium]|nr:response regulator transcription factor [Rhodothermales bacterium]
MRILVLEDEARLSRSLQTGLEEEGYRVDVAHDGVEGEALARSGVYDALIVDWRLPLREGPEVIARLRADGFATPVLMLTARVGVEDRVAGLDAGADDYLGKPFAFDEMLARLRALLRRAAPRSLRLHLTPGNLVLDEAQHLATLAAEPLGLRPKEFALLVLLARHPGQIVRRERMVDLVWGDTLVSPNTLEVTVSGVRSRLLNAARAQRIDAPEIETVRGVGYRLHATPA